MAAKRIVFADTDLRTSDAFLRWADAQNARQAWPVLADLPAEAAAFSRGDPVLTVLVGPQQDVAPGTIESLLARRVAQTRAILGRLASVAIDRST
jgi:hypothetical protein